MSLTWVQIGKLTDEELRNAACSKEGTSEERQLLFLEVSRRMGEAQQQADEWNEKLEYRELTYILTTLDEALKGQS